MLICKFCSKECHNLNSLRNHERLCRLNTERKPTWLELNPAKNGKGWNKGLTKKTDSRVEAYGKKIKEGISLGKIPKPGGAIQTQEGLRRLSDFAKKNNLGGHNSKKQMQFTKKDGTVVYLQSSYEIKFAQLLEELNLTWTRPLPIKWVDSSGISHRYYPDFEVHGILVDTKNDFLIKKDKEKIEAVMDQNKVQIFIVSKENINKEYILETILPK